MKVLTIQCGDQVNKYLNTKFNVISVPNSKLLLDHKEHLDLLLQVDCVVFGAGLHVDPSIYNCPKHEKTIITQGSSERDTDELALYEECLALDIPCVGIDRGAQLLAVRHGAELYQEINNHNSTHNIITSDNKTIEATSTHSQSVYFDEFPDDMDILALSDESTVAIRTAYQGFNLIEVVIEESDDRLELEVFRLEESKTLCIQGHPEFQLATSEYKEFCMQEIKNTIIGGNNAK